MDKKFLNRVVDHIVKETRMEFTVGKMYTPFQLPSSSFLILSCSFFFPSLPLLPPFTSFLEHCAGIYSLNRGEIDYVWNEYGNIIHDKIKNEQEVSK
jgi:hypothetical protein